MAEQIALLDQMFHERTIDSHQFAQLNAWVRDGRATIQTDELRDGTPVYHVNLKAATQPV